MNRKLSWVAAVSMLAVSTFALGACAPAGGGGGGGNGQLPVTYNVTASLPYVLHPDLPPAGSDVWSCVPSAAHPRPVILVNGTIATMGENWSVLAPLLKNAGYCVFAFDYGTTWLSNLTLGNIDGLDSVGTSAHALANFVDQVLAATGAAQVDMVGHSQGGMMPNYYLKFLGGGPKVHTLIALAPDNHGTTLDALVSLGQAFTAVFPLLFPFVNAVIGLGIPSLVDQEVGSPFMQQMATVADTVPGVSYTVIASQYDEVVTPYTSAFLTGPAVTNITVQDQCGLDFSEHLSLAFDHIALQDVANALDPAHPVAPVCSKVDGIVGG